MASEFERRTPVPESSPLHYYFEAASAALQNLKEALAVRQHFNEAAEVRDLEFRVNGIYLVVIDRENSAKEDAK